VKESPVKPRKSAFSAKVNDAYSKVYSSTPSKKAANMKAVIEDPKVNADDDAIEDISDPEDKGKQRAY
jgi:hypothetical protein